MQATAETGISMDYEKARFNMVEQQVRPWEVLDSNVLAALSQIKREDFAPVAYRNLAFSDLEIPLGHGQSMLPPRMEARLLQDALIEHGNKVLQVGTGSGYLAALIAHLVGKGGKVTSVEIEADLAKQAVANLSAAGMTNVSVQTGDASAGWSKDAPYDVIVVSGALPQVPEELLRQLVVGGRMVVVTGQGALMVAQRITRELENSWMTINLFEVVVPELKTKSNKSSFCF